MPKNTITPLTKTQQLNTYELRKANIGEKLEVVARPTDPYVSPVRAATNIAPDPGLTALIKTADNVNNTVVTYGKLQEVQREENKLKAREDAKNGTYNKPSSFLNVGAGYDAEFNFTKGEADMLKAKSEAAQELALNRFFIDSPEADKKRQEVIDKAYTKYFGNVPQDNIYAFAGASAQYKDLQQYATQGYAKEWVEKHKAEHAEAINTLVGNQVDLYRNDQQQKNVPFDYLTFRNRLGDMRKDIDPNVFSKEQQGKVIVNAVISKLNSVIKNENAKNPDGTEMDDSDKKMLIADVVQSLKTPDRDGVNWYETLDDKGDAYLRQVIDGAEYKLNNTVDQIEENLIRKNNRVYEDNAEYYTSQLLLEKDPTEITKMVDTLKVAYDENELDDRRFNDVLKVQKAILQGDLYVTEDPKKVVALQINALQGKAKLSEVYAAVADGTIRRDTALGVVGIIERVKAQQQAAATSAGAANAALSMQSYNQGLQALVGIYGGKEGAPPEQLAGVVEHYDYLVKNDPKFVNNPIAAKKEIIRTYGTDGAILGNPYPDAKTAAQAYETAKVQRKRGAISQADYLQVERNFKPWALRSQHTLPVAPRKPTTRPTE